MKNRVRLLAMSMLAAAMAVSGCGGGAGSKDLYALLALLSPSTWVRTSTAAPGYNRFFAVDEYGGCLYAAGSITGNEEYDFGNGVTVQQGLDSGDAVTHCLLVKYDISGRALWARTLAEGPDYSGFAGVAAGSDGVYAVGTIINRATALTYKFSDAVSVQGNAVFSSGRYNVVIVKYSLDGEPLWARSIVGGSNDSYYFEAARDSDGVYVAGQIDGILEFDFGNSKTATGVFDGPNSLLVKYDSSGTVQWAKTAASGTSSSFFKSVCAPGGGIYAAGAIRGNAEFNFGGTATATGGYASLFNPVVVKYDSSGTAQWARTATVAPSFGMMNGIAGDSSGVYAAGYVDSTGEYNFGDGVTVTTPSDYDHALVVKYGHDGVTQWAASTEAALHDSRFNDISVSSGGVFASGYIYADGEYDFGDGVTVSGACDAKKNMAIVRYDAFGTAQWAGSTVLASDSSELYDISAASHGVYGAGEIKGTSEFVLLDDLSVTGDWVFENILLLKAL